MLVWNMTDVIQLVIMAKNETEHCGKKRYEDKLPLLQHDTMFQVLDAIVDNLFRRCKLSTNYSPIN